MDYISAAEASQKWDVSLRQVQRLLAEGRIPRAKKYGRLWMIPDDAEKPDDLRREKKLPSKSILFDLDRVIASTSTPMPFDNPYSLLDTVNEDRMRLIYEAELAYLRGDFERTMQCYLKIKGDDAAMLRVCSLAIAAAISTGDYKAYTEMESYLKGCVEDYKGSVIAVIAEHSLATAAVSVIAPNMAPDWLKEGDFSRLTPGAKPNAFYLRAKYFQCLNKPDIALAVAQTALTLSSNERGFTTTDIYLRVACAVACGMMGQYEEAKRWLLDAMRMALPHRFITPFAEIVSIMSGLVEQCLKQEFPGCYDAVIRQWKDTWKNWISFHNQFTNDNITLMLSLREYQIALLVARRVPYAKIAKQYCISVGRVKNIMLEIYEKLFISGRDELAKYVF